VERIEANKTVFHAAEVDIKDQAIIRSYLFNEHKTFDLQAGPLELMLFCVRQGQVVLQASFIPHPLEISSGEAIFLAYPRDQWQVKIIGEAASEFYTIRMEVGTLHQLMNPAFDSKSLNTEQRLNMRDLMRLIPVNPALIMCFDQLIHHKLNPPFASLFEQAKFMEIFSLLMESAFGQQGEVCPVALSPAIEYKLGRVRQHIMDNIDEVPDPDQLANLYELPRNTLKEGYKFKYGKSLHQFHTDHKLESAMQMVASGEMLVKEIAFRIGYQNPSHFISAFKKKFGFTPKQFVKREG
jgi:AraC family transcriptional regulator, transcriptional activator of the genes for pyochelin and ferripyochelin receptors